MKLISQLSNYFNSLSKTTKFIIVSVFILGFIGIFLQLLFPDRSPAVTTISPQFTRGIPENSNFTISFGNILTKEQQKKLSFSIEPAVEMEKYWFDNNYQYYFQNKELLKNNTQYTILVKYKNKEIFSHSFVTSEFTFEEQQEQIREQGRADIEFGEAIQNLKDNFTWYDDIPIDNEQFTIIYDYDLEKFRIRLKVSESTNEEIKTNLTNKALSTMKEKNIDPETWGYYVLYLN